MREIPEHITEHLFLDPQSPTQLRWVRPIGRAKVTGVAGCIRSDGYVQLNFEGERYFGNRVVYYLVHGTIPDNSVIRHIDGNPTNNSPENLIAMRRRSREEEVTVG